MTARAERPLLGILCRIGSSAGFAVMAATVKLGSNHGLGLVELVFFRSAIATLVILGCLAAAGRLDLLRTQRPLLHLRRSGIGGVGLIFNFAGFIFLPLSQSVAISFAMPLFATMMSALLLGEPVGRHRWGAVALGFVGVLLLVRPDHAGWMGMLTLLPLIGAALTALVVVTIRQMAATEHGLTIAFYFSLFCTLGSAVALPFASLSWPTGLWGVLITLGVSGGIAQMLMSMALHYAPVGTVVPFDYTQLLFAGVLAWLLFAEMPSMDTLIGGAVIVASGLYILHRELIRRRAISPISSGPKIP